jgi:ABC-2 type transport system permease protein
VTGVALLAQMEIGGSGIDLVGLYTLALLVNFAGTLWATGVAMRLRTQQAAPVMQMPVFLVLFFAPVYVPLNLLEGWIHGVASANPVTALLEAGRGLISGRPELTLAAFAIALALIGAFTLWAVRGLRRAEAAG